MRGPLEREAPELLPKQFVKLAVRTQLAVFGDCLSMTALLNPAQNGANCQS